MKKFVFAAVLVPLLSIGTPLINHSAYAQSLTVGSTDKQILNILRQNGYTNGKVTKRALTIVRTEACKGNDKFSVKVSILGRITSASKIGTCPKTLVPLGVPARYSAEQASAKLQSEGYTRVKTQQRGNGVFAVACQGNDRVEILINAKGQVTSRNITGTCGLGTPASISDQLTELLSKQGFKKIVITDSQLPRYAAEACKDNERVRLTLNRRGRVVSERRIGNCRAQFNPSNLAELVENKGYSRVKILRGNRPPYLLEACKDNRLMELRISRSGEIRREEPVGRCTQVATEDQIRERYVNEGYSNVRLERSADAWNARMCRDDQEISKVIDAYGETVSQRRVGTCKSETVINLLKTLEGRGASNLTLNVEGCYDKKKYRWNFDRLGTRTGFEEIGKC